MTGLRWGVTSDVGRSRSVNQDSVLAEAPLFVVADGMGGHAAGEVASQLALGIARQHVGPGRRPSLDVLVDAVAVANRAVFEQARNQAELRGMGTTFCGLALLEGDDGTGPHIALVNVGDSRAYVVRADGIHQLTRDHSYVEDLVEAGEITALEARSHPQRHIVTRALGVEPNVLVDTWERPATVGERYIICSDGLSNELEDRDIEQLSKANTDPQDAADRLVQLANDRGGRDNVSVLVVDVVGDGFDGRIEVPAPPVGLQVDDLRAMAQPNAAFGAPSFTTPAWAMDDGALPDLTGASSTATTLTDTTLTDEPLPPPAPPAPPSPAPTPDAKAAKRQRRPRPSGPSRLRTVIRNVSFLAVFLVVLGFALGSIQAYGRAGWYMTFRNDQVTLYQGRAEGLLWVKPQAKATYPLTRTELDAGWQQKIDARITFTSREAAERWYGLLAANPDAVPRLAASTTTTTAPTTTTAAGPTTTNAVPTTSPSVATTAPALGVDTTSAAAPVVDDTTVPA